MNHASSRMRYLAERIIKQELGERGLPSTEFQISGAVIQKLKPKLVDLMGNNGFYALVSRALALSKEEVPWLAGARLNKEGILEEFEDSHEPAAHGRTCNGGSVMLASMLGLLSSFIGELLTMQLVLEVWPKLQLDGYFLQAYDHEKNL